MNNNRGNNRRRGRGNNRQQGGGQQLNRIDSRTRGNAPQLLEKYRKLAHDAHLNGDRVTEEYNLQFADHYFRVIADTRLRQEEGRQRRDERWQENGDADREDGDFGGEYGADGDYATYDQTQRRDRPQDQQRSDNQRADNQRADRPRGDHQRPRGDDDANRGETAGDSPAAPRTAYEPADNPFMRDNRGPRRDDRRSRPAPRTDADDNGPPAFDASALPPAIAPSRDDAEEVAAKPVKAPRARKATAKPEAENPEAENGAATAPVEAAAEDGEAKPRKRAVRRPRPAADDTVEAVN